MMGVHRPGASLLFAFLFVALSACSSDETSNEEEPEPSVECEVGEVNPDCEPCADGTYDHDSDPSTECQTWTDCGPGEQIASPGSTTEDRTCEACQSGTYNDSTNADECVSWTNCEAGEVVDSEGTTTSDRVCGTCNGGYTDETNADQCILYTKCEAGEFVSTPQTGSSDRDCSSCSDGTFSDFSNADTCMEWLDCQAGEIVDTKPGATSDRVCVECPTDFTSAGTNLDRCIHAEWSMIEVSQSAICAIRESDGRPLCWRSDNGGQISEMPDGLQLKSVRFGFLQGCGIERGTDEIRCWGGGTLDELTNAPAGTFEKLDSRNEVSCALSTVDATPACWGLDSAGEISGVPSTPMTDISIGSGWVCGVRDSDGFLECWGAQQLVDLAPTDVAFSSIALGDSHGCAIRAADSGVECWGTAEDPPAGEFDRIVAGANHSCARQVSDQTVICWGRDTDGQVSDAPTEPLDDLSVHFSTCGISSTNGSLVCWGENSYAGIPPYFQGPNPQAFESLEMAGSLICPLTSDGTQHCFGQDGAGQISDIPAGPFDTISPSTTYACGLSSADGSISCWGGIGAPTTVSDAPTESGFLDVESGGEHACAIQADSTVVCWGSNTASQLDVPATLEVSQISLGFRSTCVIRADNSTVECWGEDRFSQPLIPPTGEFESLSTGSQACGIRSTDQSIECWGGSAADQNTTLPSGAFAEISVAGPSGCGLRANGQAECWRWGVDMDGIVDETPTDTFDTIRVGGSTACGLRSLDGSLLCWGLRFVGPRF